MPHIRENSPRGREPALHRRCQTSRGAIMRICVPALVGILSCVAVAVFGQNPDLAGTWKRTQTDSSAICKIEQTDASISLNLKTHFQAGELSGWSNGTET